MLSRFPPNLQSTRSPRRTKHRTYRSAAVNESPPRRSRRRTTSPPPLPPPPLPLLGLTGKEPYFVDPKREEERLARLYGSGSRRHMVSPTSSASHYSNRHMPRHTVSPPPQHVTHNRTAPQRSRSRSPRRSRRKRSPSPSSSSRHERGRRSSRSAERRDQRNRTRDYRRSVATTGTAGRRRRSQSRSRDRRPEMYGAPSSMPPFVPGCRCKYHTLALWRKRPQLNVSGFW